MSQYYSVKRSSDCLEHTGIRGMKWGVRKKKKMAKFLKNLKEDVKYGAKAAGLSLLIGPSASFVMASRRAATDPNYCSGKSKRNKSK